MKNRRLVTVICIAVMLVMVFGLVGSAGASAVKDEDSGSGEKYKIALCNSFMGNDWRQIMQKVAELVAQDPYYADRVTLEMVNTEHTPEAQSASIDALSQQDYDAFIVDAASPTAITPALKRAADKGIAIVVFDQVVDSDEFYKMQSDWHYVAEASAKFIAAALDGKGNVVMDRGLSGSPIAKILYDDAMAIFAEYPEIQVVAEFESEFAEGPAEQGVAAAMTANPQIDAVYSQGYVSAIARAFKNAGKPIPVITGGGSNGTVTSALEDEYVVLCWNANLAGFGAMAMETAVQILDGNPPAEKNLVLQDAIFLSLNPEISEEIGIPIVMIEEGVNAFPEYPPSFSWPVLPEDFPVQLEPEDII